MPLTKKQLHQRWLVYAVAGLATFGFGLSLVGDAIMVRAAGATFWRWFAYGALALVVTNTGLCLFGQAVIYRIQLLNTHEKDQ